MGNIKINTQEEFNYQTKKEILLAFAFCW